MVKKSKHYFNNRDFMQCIVEHQEAIKAAELAGRRRPNLPRYAGECFDNLCEKMSRRANFNSYSYRDEMVGDAILDCVAAFEKFDPVKGQNPFGYFSRVAWMAMLRRNFDEKSENYVKHKNFVRLHGLDEHYVSHEHWTDPRAIRSGPSVGDKSNPVANTTSVSDDVIQNFEELLVKRRKPKETA